MTKRFKELNIGDTFQVEYGAYGNYTDAVIQAIEATQYEHIKLVTYTIPHYTGDELHQDRMLLNNLVRV